LLFSGAAWEPSAVLWKETDASTTNWVFQVAASSDQTFIGVSRVRSVPAGPGFCRRNLKNQNVYLVGRELPTVRKKAGPSGL
jgi:hypothetical protein